jgi:hypothetical protein
MSKTQIGPMDLTILPVHDSYYVVLRLAMHFPDIEFDLH